MELKPIHGLLLFIVVVVVIVGIYFVYTYYYKNERGKVCTYHQDCPSHLCVDSRCIDKCNSEHSCSDGYTCVEGVCTQEKDDESPIDNGDDDGEQKGNDDDKGGSGDDYVESIRLGDTVVLQVEVGEKSRLLSCNFYDDDAVTKHDDAYDPESHLQIRNRYFNSPQQRVPISYGEIITIYNEQKDAFLVGGQGGNQRGTLFLMRENLLRRENEARWILYNAESEERKGFVKSGDTIRLQLVDAEVGGVPIYLSGMRDSGNNRVWTARLTYSKNPAETFNWKIIPLV